MTKLYTFMLLTLLVGTSFAKPCISTHRSCLKLKNQNSQSAKIECNWLSEVTSAGNSQGSTQLDLSYGDGLGAPEPRQLSCKLTIGETKQSFEFHNPYWGSLIEFNLISQKKLDVHVTDGWSSRETRYSFSW
ncbi:hypothetical protein OQJ18_02840 [Fluoribacter dumoffii]|uniref:Uncharacterized protein n=1 Tax=Fluoribacter dumoffii TaxID=463 RepID=A0A377GBQ6_9GAMM|nr:hypothetical protein [Fluoribacter dumoffii]KTC88784.1 hypothetical protein Ldum_3042 [Fluoribacter dumoffii NY 23]MCW8385921.1 hypothetical protein [Fluoribacter dumoffii]MCW8418974.1 hypothetical protein [Fluoribacter dumoffii]MCW8453182.1 hypothetical protein [Fluoribacter dumoffii]MCW8459597.1 hypothetical protein [Fluoribacter dumoffii]